MDDVACDDASGKGLAISALTHVVEVLRPDGRPETCRAAGEIVDDGLPVGREYFAAHHSVERAVDAYEALFDRLGPAQGTRTG